MTTRRKIYTAACIPIVALSLLLAGGVADATTVRPEVAVVADESCGQSATLTIYNQAWWFGLTEDAEVVLSNAETIVPLGTKISIEAPFVATFPLDQDLVIELVIQFPHEPEKLTTYLIPIDFNEQCVPVTTTTSTTAEPTTPSSASPAPVAPPAQVVETTPVVTG